jgi:hypothetical protein
MCITLFRTCWRNLDADGVVNTAVVLAEISNKPSTCTILSNAHTIHSERDTLQFFIHL